MKNLCDTGALRHRFQGKAATLSGRLVALLLCFVLCVGTLRAENRPGNVVFHYNAGSGWQYNKGSVYESDSWYIDITPSNSDVYLVMTNRMIDDPTNWSALTSASNTVFHFGTGNSDGDNNTLIGFGASSAAYLYGGGPGTCIHLTGCPVNQIMRIKLSYSSNDGGVVTFSTQNVQTAIDYFVHGNFTGSWVSHKMSGADNEYIFTYTFPQDGSTAEYEFGIKTTKNGNDDGWFATQAQTSYTQSPMTMPLANTGVKNIVLPKGLKGTVAFRLKLTNGVPAELTVTGGYPSISGGDDDMVTLYMHFEEDYLKQGKQDEVPFCHVFTYGNGGSQYLPKGSDGERMTLVNKTYQIWAFSLPASEAAKFNRVRFFFNTKYGGSNEYESGWNADNVSFDEANWSKYIYAVHSGTIAVQTYLTYDEFMAEAQKGYRRLYVTGGGDTGASIKLTREDGSETYLGWDPANPTVVDQWREGVPLFFMRYVPTTVNGNARFKLSWMDVKSYKEKNAGNYANGERDWATYDLGIIGVDDEMCEKNQSVWGANLVGLESANAENGWGTSRTSFFVNKALPLLEYNQYDWTMNENMANSGVRSGSTYWVVVDMHPDCRTVTLCTFDPNPQVRVNASEVATSSIDAAVAAAIHSNGAADHFSSSETNGHILTTEVNHINGSVNIIGGKDENGNDVSSDDFKRLAEDARLKPTYTVSMNGSEVFEYEGLPQTLAVEYMPLAAANSIGIGAMYTSEVTGLHFHVKPGNGTVTTQAAFVAPKDQEVYGNFIPFYEYPNKKGNGNIEEKEYRATFHITGEVPYELNGNTGLAYYPDFSLNDIEMGVMRDDYRSWLDIPAGTSVASMNYTKFDFETDSWNANRHNWSGNIRTAGKFPYIVYGHHKCEISGSISVPDADYTGKLYAIYPVVYKLHPTVSVVDRQAAPRRAAKNIDSENYGLVNYITEGNLRIKAEQRHVTTGVEDIAVGNTEAVEYYTLQGVRVEGEPAPGLYIRKQGQQATKVCIK